MKCWLSLALFASLLVAGLPARALSEAELKELLAAELVAGNMPGLRGAVRWSDGREIGAAVGFADLDTERALDENVPIPGGSTGKTFVAAVALLLVEDGVVSLDDPAARWLGTKPWFERLPNADTMRVRHLLSHSAGIVDYPATMRFQFANAWRRLRRGSAFFTPEELIGFALDRRAPFAPGQGFAYSDTGYLVLGRLLESAAGETYYNLLRTKILEPRKLEDVQPVESSNPPGVPNGYNDGGPFGLSPVLDKRGRMKFDPASEWTGGGLNTTPRMLVRFYAALAEGRIVQPATFADMVAAGYRDPDRPRVHYGLGMFVDDRDNSIMHGGRWPGYRTWVKHFIDDGLTIAVQTNRDGNVDLAALIERLADLAR